MDHLPVLQQRDQLSKQLLMRRCHDRYNHNTCTCNHFGKIIGNHLRISESATLVAIHIHLEPFDADSKLFNVGERFLCKFRLIPDPYVGACKGAVSGNRFADTARTENRDRFCF